MGKPCRFLSVRPGRTLPSWLRAWSQALRGKPLLHRLSIVLLLKTALLWLLWAVFIRDQHVAVDPARMGSRLTLSPFFSNVPIGGSNDRPVRC
jgi:hypothetical protein